MTELLRLNYFVNCIHNCNECEKYFDCNSDYKASIEYKPIVRKLREKMKNIRYKIAVMGGKGGVGKSTVSANLAIALAKNHKVGLIDMDFDGPSIPRLLRVKEKRMKLRDEGFSIIPAEGPLGIKVISTGLVYDEDQAIIWQFKQRQAAIEQFLSLVDYGELDFLVMDLPPGTGSETVNLLKYLPDLSGIVIVTIPAELARDVTLRGIRLCQKAGAPVIGLVENMSGIICPDCQTVIPAETNAGENLAKTTGINLLGKIAYDPRVTDLADRGVAFMKNGNEMLIANTFSQIVSQIEHFLSLKSHRHSPRTYQSQT